MHEFVVATELVVVEVVDDDVVGSRLTVAQTTRRLSTTAGKELDTALRLELTLLPAAFVLLLSEVGDEPLVVFELSLDVAKESVGIVFGLADNDHEIDEPFGLEHQP